MDSDVCRNTARFLNRTLPRYLIPTTSRGDISQTNIALLASVAVEKLISELDQLWMHAQLKNVIDPTTGFILQLLQSVQIPRVYCEWFLANRVCAYAQCQSAVCIVKIVR